jgi:hypothetical protein
MPGKESPVVNERLRFPVFMRHRPLEPQPQPSVGDPDDQERQQGFADELAKSVSDRGRETCKLISPVEARGRDGAEPPIGRCHDQASR